MHGGGQDHSIVILVLHEDVDIAFNGESPAASTHVIWPW